MYSDDDMQHAKRISDEIMRSFERSDRCAECNRTGKELVASGGLHNPGCSRQTVETVTAAGITMSRKRYEERAAAYAACDHGCAAFEPTSFLADRDFSKPEPKADQPWSCDDVDYVI